MALHPSALPDFPWDSLTPFRERAAQHPGGVVDLSVGTPVDPTPAVVRDALIAAADAPGYPQTYGTPPLRETVAAWFARRRGVPDVDPAGVLPTIGSKEMVALLPALLGLGEGDTVVHPTAAYPTYDVGARLSGATPFPADAVEQWQDDPTVRLVWINSPSNPTGEVLSREELRRVVVAARRLGAVVASDECYAELPWDEPWITDGVPSILDPEVAEGSHEGLLSVYSLSKQSNLAGYRAAFVAGDPGLVKRLLEVRKHAGFLMPAPVQAAMAAALADDAHVEAQREVYRARRDALKPALEQAGFRVEGSQAGLYLWSTRDEDCWDTLASLADLGLIVAPGAFYGEAARQHVRVALTATDERISEAVRRLAKLK
ncbi:succinyldiaminopimelate transaminase [Demequina zhanjiangensis]|uniref:Aminotransferase n=1 Tax=Demequina zhanjiangensis TaxID=3051659 RepID=A0ABT8G0Y3_9MICO|nr:succinyldiaminopimelate transaminase [Demequina sp. SYSU T00b26]MDN4472796.1 succinyldiaminopimelate transaminase [Demequina sp. SYSU T00b26]